MFFFVSNCGVLVREACKCQGFWLVQGGVFSEALQKNNELRLAGSWAACFLKISALLLLTRVGGSAILAPETRTRHHDERF